MTEPTHNSISTGAGPARPQRATTIAGVFRHLARRPGQCFIQRWNWKSALMSSLARGLIFFAVNVGVSLDAAAAAMATEVAYRIVAAGLYGSCTQAFRHVEPFWKAIVCTMILLPMVSHTAEFILHFYRGTERLGWSLLFSVCFTAVTTTFNLFAMRRGLLVVGESGSTLLDDLRAMPAAILAYLHCLAAPLRQWIGFLWTRSEQSCK